MQSAANFMEAFLVYNSAIMPVRTMQAVRFLMSWGLALALAAAAGPLALAIPGDEPDPAPTPGGTPAVEAAPGSRGVFGTIMGTVYDAKKPLVGCMVQLSSRGEGAMLRVTGTDEKGRYVFKDLPAGTYDIEVAAVGGVSRRKGKIEVRPPFRNIVDFEIRPEGDEARDAAATRLAEALKKVTGVQDAPAPGAPVPGEPAKMVPVRGTFLDAQKRPIPEVSVMFLSLEEKGTFQAFSGEDGAFSLPAVPPGRYRVLVASPGYVALDLRSVEVSPAGGLNLGLSLVDYPLNFKGRPEDRLPPEEPLQVPSESRGGVTSPAS
jgi:hypothetical protein